MNDKPVIDKAFAVRVLDKMLEWDKHVVDRQSRGIWVSDEDMRVLYDAYDYFFYLVLEAELTNIDKIHEILMELCQRVSKVHRNHFFEGFFQALAQMLMLQKLMLSHGKDAWFNQWQESFKRSITKLGV